MWVLELGCLPHSLAATLPVTSVARFPSLYNRVDCDSLTELLWNVTKWMNKCEMRHWDHWWANNIREILAVINTSAVISTIALRYYCWMLVLPVISWCLPAAPSDLSGPAVALWEGTITSSFANRTHGYPDLVSRFSSSPTQHPAKIPAGPAMVSQTQF